ncbi:CDP-diacylglycerol--serine O-phosphatidyltransferase [Effusibacillus lacus]|uniref:CDP-diacylglycerol--serine O-phosphatidyltransferase n=1 Tax=Effusibacillus lacus TaxID=1348429 RepID=A0A292YKB5_9BACL|nr:CDP-diacylglycerol--serine O-phosphatidyltransferase [Effusibacillus lacus]TCS69146.1 CDP-diacylglycerol--serine O-phosphatidyltransferase [Effusibacillus lacus]GAX89349.1 CDP-diacylglycerol--serine O-phosphatidyltransferase [Effusibacillus lacus]
MFVKALPSAFTLGNLFLGIISIILAFNDEFGLAAILVIVGMLLDGLDGRIARALNATSEFGKELDSLSDVISFGVAPAFIMYGVILHQLGWVGMVITGIFPICGALRLARFNVMAGNPNYFVGLPITAAGGILATMALYQNLIPASKVILPIAMLGLSYLMISRIKYPNFKKVGIPKAAYWIVPVLAAFVTFVFVYYPEQASKLIFLPLALYAIYGLKKNYRTSKKKRKIIVQDSLDSKFEL